MRFLKRVLFTVVAFAAGSLLELPGEVVKHLYTQPIADFIRDRIGFTVPQLETFISTLFLLAPFLAAISAIYLYHKFYLYIIRKDLVAKYALIVALEQGPRVNVTSGLSIFALSIFVVVSLHAKYHEIFAAPIQGPLRFTEIHELSNLDLRDRALSVARDLRILGQEYSARRGPLETAYDGQRHEFDTKMAEFQEKKTAYDVAILLAASIAAVLFFTINLASAPQCQSSLLNLNFLMFPQTNNGKNVLTKSVKRGPQFGKSFATERERTLDFLTCPRIITIQIQVSAAMLTC